MISTGKGRVAGVIGWPVGHSQSPKLHNFWLSRHGLDGAYVPLPVPPGQLTQAVRGLVACGFAGVNVTIPYKVEVMGLCDHVRPAGKRAGAVNTLVFTRDGIVGDNTDGAGFVQHLKHTAPALPPGPALLLGAGGAARAIAASLLDAGRDVVLCNRTVARAETLARDLPGMRILPWADREAALGEMALLVNTTSLGMTGQPSLQMRLNSAPRDLVVADIVYSPLLTPLLKDAASRGLRTVGGLGMLLHQAVPGFAAWFGVTPAVDEEVVSLMTGIG